MIKHLLSISILFIALNTFSQTIYQSGYIIKNNGDTVKGLIAYKKPNYTIRSIEFKMSESGQPTQYGPADLKNIFINPYNYYISYNGLVSNNKNYSPDMDEERDTTTSVASLFLQQVISGPNVTLYANTNNLKTRYFYQEKGKRPVELIYYEYGHLHEAPHKEAVYTGQLSLLYNAYNKYDGAKAHAIENTDFTEGSLENAFTLINGNKTDKKLKSSDIRLFAGVSVASVTSNASFTVVTLPITSKSNDLSPQINMGVDFIINPDIQKIIFRLGASFAYLKPNFNFTYLPTGNYNNNYSFRQYVASLVPEVFYNFYNKVNFKLFLSAGVSLNYYIYKNSAVNYYNYTETSTHIPVLFTYTDMQYSTLSVDFPLRAGVVLCKHTQISINYLPSLTPSPGLKFQSFGMGVNYLF
jgi:hypothetical protein